VQRTDVVLQRLLHPDAERGEQQRAVHALLVEQLHASVTIAVGGVRVERLQVAEHGLHVQAALVLAPEVGLERAGLGDRVEGRVRDELVDLPAHQQALFAVHLGPLHAALLHGGIDVAD
jgi:hypothetical protein